MPMENYSERPPKANVVHHSKQNQIIKQGESALLPCIMDRPVTGWWLRNMEPFFQNTGQPFDKEKAKRFSVLGKDWDQGNYSLQLENAQPEDSGNYSCQVADESQELNLWTYVHVEPARKMITQPPASAPNALGPSTVLLSAYSSLSQVAADSPMVGANELDLSSSYPPIGKSALVINNNKAREAVMGLTQLSGPHELIANAGSSAHKATLGHHHQSTHHQYATVRASSASPASSTGLISGSTSAGTHHHHGLNGQAGGAAGMGLHNLALVWPYLLLALAALLMLANVYLIVSLIKRHTRCSKEREANRNCDEDEDPSLA